MRSLRPYDARADRRAGMNRDRRGLCSSVWCRRPAVKEWTTSGGRTRYLCAQETALEGLLASYPERWGYLAPLRELRPLFRRLREPSRRLRKQGGETRQDGSLVANQYRMGPLTMAARRAALAEVLDIQSRINSAARAADRPEIDTLNTEERERILELIEADTWPQRWSGDEPRADEPFGEGLLDWTHES